MWISALKNRNSTNESWTRGVLKMGYTHLYPKANNFSTDKLLFTTGFCGIYIYRCPISATAIHNFWSSENLSGSLGLLDRPEKRWLLLCAVEGTLMILWLPESLNQKVLR
jgi:hypothetical protein